MTVTDVASRGETRRPSARADLVDPSDSVGFWERHRPAPETTTAWVASVAVVVLVVGFFGLASYTDADTWVPISVVFFLSLISVGICARVAGMPRDRRLFKILVLAFALKMLFTGPRYILNEVYYGGEVDAARYDQAGDFFVQNVANGHFSIEGSELDAFPKETRVVGYAVGVLYVIFGTTYFGGYLIFSWLSWLGLLCFFKAFRIAFPNAPPYRAALLIFFLPSMLFWPSSLGKEAVMVFCLGVSALGVARLLTGTRALLGIVWIVLSFGAMLQIRPHLVLVSTLALAGSQFARSTKLGGVNAAAFRIVVLAALFPLLLLGLTRLDAVFGTKDGSAASIEENLDSTLKRTNTGNSAFEAQAVRSPVDVPASFLTVVYRPFLFEASNVGLLISAAEGTLLIILTLMASRWIWRIGPAMVSSPFAAYCGIFVVGFVVAFSNIGNAGILARQRVQMFPFLMLAAAAAHEHYRTAQLAAADPADTLSSDLPDLAPARPALARLDRSTP